MNLRQVRVFLLETNSRGGQEDERRSHHEKDDNKYDLSIACSITGIVNGNRCRGIIYTDTTWDLAGSPYNITSLLQIADNVTLTIAPGVVVNGISGCNA